MLSFAASKDVVLSELGASRRGLSPDEAERRLLSHGLNKLPEVPVPSVIKVFTRQFASPFIYILLVAVVLSLLLQEWSNAGFVSAVVVLNAVIGTVQEHRAERSAQALRQLITTHSKVVRDGDVTEIDATYIVAGDLVLIASGDKVPADIRLLDSRDLQVDESLLTGESMAVTKDSNSVLSPDTGLAERVNMAFAGTLVSRGRGEGVVVATGLSTEIGSLARELSGPAAQEPPLVMRMRRFTHRVAAVMIIVAAIFAFIEAARGTPIKDVALVAIALAVSAIPEGLPIALTVALAIATRRMADRNVVVRRMVAVESLGSCTTIATDKTGTLTVNELTATDIVLPGGSRWGVSGVGTVPTGNVLALEPRDAPRRDQALTVALAGALCNEAVLASEDSKWIHHGDPVDVSLLVLAHKVSITRPGALVESEQVSQIPFESERRYAATLHRRVTTTGDAATLYVKGAVEAVLAMCSLQMGVSGEEPVVPEGIRADVELLATHGRRVIALARREIDEMPHEEFGELHLNGLTFLGIVGLLDPPRPTAVRTICACYEAGVRVVMVTGDHPATALAIARQVGMASGSCEVVTGQELSRAMERDAERPYAAFDDLVARSNVFARVEPVQKLEIINSLIRQGELVAVTGDGANDAPALRQAHVGVAMGKGGTDVAREAADLIVTDDDLSSIVAGIEEGRVAYGNIRKVISLLVSTGAAELVFILAALATGMPTPLTAIQLLWLNLVTNGIQDVALAFEPAEGTEMRLGPRPSNEGIFNGLMLRRIAVTASVIGIAAFAAYRMLMDAGWSLDAARNAAVLLMVLFENVMVLNSRSETMSFFDRGFKGNRILVVGTAMALGTQVLAMHWTPARDLLGLGPIPGFAWGWTVVVAASLLLVVELDKLIWRFQHARTA